MFGRNSSVELLKKIMKLDTVEFLGICRILEVKLFEEVEGDEYVGESKEGARPIGEIKLEPRSFTDLWIDLCDKVDRLSRTRRKNLNRLVSAALKKGKDKED